MKLQLSFFVAFFFWVQLAFTSTTNVSPTVIEDMKSIAEEMSGEYYSNALPREFSDKGLSEEDYPEFTPEFLATLQRFENISMTQWKNFVEEQWLFSLEGGYSEFDFKSESYKNFIQNNPHRFLGLSQGSRLNDLENIYAIFKNYQLIGYVVELTNSVRSSIIEDGSGYVLYLDPELKVILSTDWDS